MGDSFQWAGSSEWIAINGGAGNDTLIASTGAGATTFNFAQTSLSSIESISHTGGNDATYQFSNNTFTSTLVGSAANDFVTFLTSTGLAIDINAAKFGSSIDSITGGTGADTFTWNGQGTPTINGGGGNDVLSISGSTSAVTFDLYGGTISNFVSFVGTSLNDQFNWSGINSFTLNGGAGTDTVKLTGAEAATYVLANGNFTNIEFISGTTGNDFVNWNGLGSYSFDLLGGGNDGLNISSSTAGKEINLYSDTYKNIEWVTGSTLADTLRGSTAAETLAGGIGADILWGGTDTAIDSLVGGNGADTFYWTRNYGNDVLVSTADDNVGDVVSLSDVALADLNIGSTVAGASNAISRSTNDIYFDFIKDGQSSRLTETLANDSIATKVMLTDTTFNLFVGGTTTGSFTGTSIADLIYAGNLSGTSLSGGLGADTLVGSSGNDTFVYGAGDTFLGQGNSADLLTAAGTSTSVEIDLTASNISGIEYVLGTSLGDILRGTTGAESLNGGEGDDHLWGRTGNDTLVGGKGADTFWFGADQGVDVIGAEGTASYSASDVVKLSGLSYSDLTFGLADSDNDAVLGFVSTTGYAGTLTIDQWTTQTNSGRLNQFIADDKTFGLALGLATTTSLQGTSLDDYIKAGTLSIAAGTINGGLGVDSIYGGSGNEYFVFDASDAIVNGGGGTDTLAMTTAGTMDVRSATIYNAFSVLVGSSLDDVIRGATRGETLQGGSGADHLWGYAGSDIMTGGVGTDTYWFTTGDATDTITQDTLNSQYDVVRLSGLNFSALSFGVASNADLLIDIGTGADTLTIQNWVGGGTSNLYRLNAFVTDDKTFGLAVANDTATNLTGTSYSDYMLGGLGADTLTAGAGDTLIGGAGNDLLKYLSTGAKFDGGTGTDTLTASALTTGITLNLYDTAISSIEYLVGTSLADILRGDTLANTLEGGSGADALWANAGNDAMIGGVGADTYWFGSGDGNDTITQDTTNNAADKVIFYNSTFSQLSFARTGTGDLTITRDSDATNTLVLNEWGNDSNTARINSFVTTDMTFGLAVGTAAGDNLSGTALADYMTGLAGDDTIGASAGADTIYGGDGNDSITYRATQAIVDGGAGTDTLTAAAATAAVEIDLRNYTTEQTQFTSIDYVIGSTYDDILRGTSNAETLSGGAGMDILWGAAGADSLAGGAGTDTYWFGGGDGNDTIATSTINSADYVQFASIDGRQILGTDVSSTTIVGNNLTITLSSGDALTLEDWNVGGGNKLNKFNFGAESGNWSLAVSGEGVATWTRIV